MIKPKLSISRLIIVHAVLCIFILCLSSAGYSHRSGTFVSLFQLPFFIWPIWLFFLGKGWLRIFPAMFAVFLMFIMTIGFLTKDEDRIGRRRFETALGQIYIVQQFDFDGSKELPDRVEIETPLPLGFHKTTNTYRRESIGKIYTAKVENESFEMKGDWGVYRFKHNEHGLQLIE